MLEPTESRQGALIDKLLINLHSFKVPFWIFLLGIKRVRILRLCQIDHSLQRMFWDSIRLARRSNINIKINNSLINILVTLIWTSCWKIKNINKNQAQQYLQIYRIENIKSQKT